MMWPVAISPSLRLWTNVVCSVASPYHCDEEPHALRPKHIGSDRSHMPPGFLQVKLLRDLVFVEVLTL